MLDMEAEIWYNTRMRKFFSGKVRLMGEINDFMDCDISSRGVEGKEDVCLPKPTPDIIHRSNLKAQHGLTLDQYDELSTQQDDKCKICGGVNRNGKRLSVDHCHKSGKIRGLLCGNCNTILGMAGDNPQILANAVEYLRDNG